MGRALVLGGGGLTGIAWTTGLLLGLADNGVDVSGADLVVGTSAGSTVAAQITTGRPLDELYAAQLADTSEEIAAELDLELLTPIFAEIDTGEVLDQAGRARVGAMALHARTVSEPVRRAVIAARLAGNDAWPERELLVTAVDALSGELVVFDGRDGTGLIDAVSASCAVPGVWPPVTVGDRRLIDGGVRSVTNADLAAGHDPVLVVLPFTTFGRAALIRELALLEDEGRTLVVSADEASDVAMGPNPLDPLKSTAAAEAGLRQAAGLVDDIRRLWLT